jgi:hypothetical protein
MKEEEENKKRNFSSCVFPAVSFLKSFFGGGLEKMSRMEFDGVEKTIWWTSKSQKKKEKGCVCVAWRREEQGNFGRKIT